MCEGLPDHHTLLQLVAWGVVICERVGCSLVWSGLVGCDGLL
jgi:hypothetical protein